MDQMNSQDVWFYSLQSIGPNFGHIYFQRLKQITMEPKNSFQSFGESVAILIVTEMCDNYSNPWNSCTSLYFYILLMTEKYDQKQNFFI